MIPSIAVDGAARIIGGGKGPAILSFRRSAWVGRTPSLTSGRTWRLESLMNVGDGNFD
jgi:hypothetical protein